MSRLHHETVVDFSIPIVDHDDIQRVAEFKIMWKQLFFLYNMTTTEKSERLLQISFGSLHEKLEFQKDILFIIKNLIKNIQQQKDNIILDIFQISHMKEWRDVFASYNFIVYSNKYSSIIKWKMDISQEYVFH